MEREKESGNIDVNRGLARETTYSTLYEAILSTVYNNNIYTAGKFGSR